MTIPPGALAGSAEVRVARRSAESARTLYETANIWGSCYELQPHGQTFRDSITPTVPLSAAQFPSPVDPDSIELMKHDGAEWIDISGRLSEYQRSISTNVKSFSWLALHRVFAHPRGFVNSAMLISGSVADPQGLLEINGIRNDVNYSVIQWDLQYESPHPNIEARYEVALYEKGTAGPDRLIAKTHIYKVVWVARQGHGAFLSPHHNTVLWGDLADPPTADHFSWLGYRYREAALIPGVYGRETLIRFDGDGNQVGDREELPVEPLSAAPDAAANYRDLVVRRDEARRFGPVLSFYDPARDRNKLYFFRIKDDIRDFRPDFHEVQSEPFRISDEIPNFPPDTRIVSGPMELVGPGVPFTITWAAEDPDGPAESHIRRYSYRIDGEPAVQTTDTERNFGSGMTLGIHTFSVAAEDIGGLVDTTPAGLTIMVAGGAACRVEPAQLDFGDVPPGGQADRTFTITNQGTLHLTGTVREACDGFEVVSGGGAFDLGANAHVDVTVRFRPTSPGAYSCAVGTGVACAPTVPCAGTCPQVDPICRITPRELNFGTIAPGTPRDMSFTIRNAGAGTLTGGTSESCAPFEIIAGGGSFSLGAGQEHPVTVRYSPLAGGSDECIIHVAGSCAASVSCRGAAGANTSPEAFCWHLPFCGGPDTDFTFDATLSHDTEDSQAGLQARYDWDADGTWDTAYLPVAQDVSHRFGTAGALTVVVEVQDSGRLTDTYVAVGDGLGRFEIPGHR